MSLNHHIRCVQKSHSNNNTIKYTRAIVVWTLECESSKSFRKIPDRCVHIVNEKWLYPHREWPKSIIVNYLLHVILLWFRIGEECRVWKKKSGLLKPLVWCIAVAWKSSKTHEEKKQTNWNLCEWCKLYPKPNWKHATIRTDGIFCFCKANNIYYTSDWNF